MSIRNTHLSFFIELKCKNDHVIIMRVQKYSRIIFWSKTTYEISKIGQNCPSLLNNVTLVSRFRAKVQKCPCHCYEGAKNAHVKFFSAKLPVKFQK